MTQLIINVENKAILPHLKKILSALDGVTIAKPERKRNTGIETSLREAREGKTKMFENTTDFFSDLGI